MTTTRKLLYIIRDLLKEAIKPADFNNKDNYFLCIELHLLNYYLCKISEKIER